MHTILIVEDSPIYQELYSEFFSEKGYRVIQAYNGDDGLKKLTNCPHDLLILDLAIPGMSGRSLLLESKKLHKDLPVFIVSGKVGMQSDPEIELCPQVREFFEKPVNLTQLSQAVEKYFHTEQDQPQKTTQREQTWIGKKIQGCVLTECLGKGSSGIVFKATRAKTDVVFKILLMNSFSRFTDAGELPSETIEAPIEIDKQERIERFRREAKILTQISHPNIITLYDVGAMEDETYYIIMEYFAGESLDATLARKRRMPLEEAINIVVHIASGMDAAHKQNLIHRDLKPSNILYKGDENALKIIDFGSARPIQVEKTLTQQGYVIGTPLYMSPEQCLGASLDQGTDIYSLGVIFFQLLTGAVPFLKEGPMQTLFAHAYEPFEWPLQYRSLAPVTIRAMIAKMLEKDKKKRPGSMAELREELISYTRMNLSLTAIQ